MQRQRILRWWALDRRCDLWGVLSSCVLFCFVRVLVPTRAVCFEQMKQLNVAKRRRSQDEQMNGDPVLMAGHAASLSKRETRISVRMA